MGIRFLLGVEIFHQAEVLFVQAAHGFFTWFKNVVYAALPNFSLDVCTKISNTNNHTHHFLYGVLIHEDTKNYTVGMKQYLKPDKKITFQRADKKDYVLCIVEESLIFPLFLFLFIFNVKMLHTDRSAHVEPYILRCTVHTFTLNQNLSINLKILSLLFETLENV